MYVCIMYACMYILGGYVLCQLTVPCTMPCPTRDFRLAPRCTRDLHSIQW